MKIKDVTKMWWKKYKKRKRGKLLKSNMKKEIQKIKIDWAIKKKHLFNGTHHGLYKRGWGKDLEIGSSHITLIGAPCLLLSRT